MPNDVWIVALVLYICLLYTSKPLSLFSINFSRLFTKTHLTTEALIKCAQLYCRYNLVSYLDRYLYHCYRFTSLIAMAAYYSQRKSLQALKGLIGVRNLQSSFKVQSAGFILHTPLHLQSVEGCGHRCAHTVKRKQFNVSVGLSNRQKNCAYW